MKEERDNAVRKVTRFSGRERERERETDDERAQEMERLAENCARAWEVTELWKKRVSEVEGEASSPFHLGTEGVADHPHRIMLPRFRMQPCGKSHKCKVPEALCLLCATSYRERVRITWKLSLAR